MFSFFGNKEKVNITDAVFMHTDAKWKSCVNMLKTDPGIVFIAWFPDTVDQLQSYFDQKGVSATLGSYRETSTHLAMGRTVIFVEHYPLFQKENDLYTSLDLKKVKVLSALDEPLFQLFGGEKIINVMRSMGLQEDEAVEHSMISRSLKNAQDKIGKKIMVEQSAQSQADWFKRNFPSGSLH